MRPAAAAGERTGPRYEAALATLRRELTDGRFRDRDMLPSERELAALLSVSRTTLRRVLATLTDAALLTQRQGIGTFVNRPGTAPPPDARPAPSRPDLVRFADDMRRRGFEPSSREIERGLGLPGARDALALGCSPGTRIVHLRRLLYADGLPIAVERGVAPAALAGEDAGPSLREALERRGFDPVRSLDRVQAVLLDEGDAARLDTAKGSPALLLSRAFYLADGRCCLFSRAAYRADRYDILSERG